MRRIKKRLLSLFHPQTPPTGEIASQSQIVPRWRGLGVDKMIFICMILTACIEPINFEINESVDLLVVEGLLTNESGPHQVRLSRSTSLAGDTFAVVSKAVLHIEEQESNRQVPLQEVSPGIYASDSGSLHGQIGHHYRLLIQTQAGEAYESKWMRLNASPAIDSISYQFEQKSTPSGTFQGLQFYLNTGEKDPENPARYFRWQWEETWKYSVPFPANFDYLGNNQLGFKAARDICYLSENSSSINIGAMPESLQGGLADHPLLFINTLDSRLQMRYSLLLRQLAMEEEEYLFWKVIKESTENVGSLFDRQPQSKTGNMRNVNDETEKVLGYFSTSAVVEKRIFLNGAEALPRGIPIDQGYLLGCFGTMDTIFTNTGLTQSELDQEVFNSIQSGRVFYNLLQSGIGPFIEGYLLTTPRCSDCTVQGGKLEKPDFWRE